MTDFVRRVLRPEQPDFIIRSLLDLDFYKFTMGYFIHRFYPDVQVKFSLINRNLKVPLARIIDEADLRAQLDHVRRLKLRRTDLYYLRGMDVYGHNMFSEDYITFLSELKLPPYTLTRVGDQYELSFEGPWASVTFWETIALAIICELMYRSLMRRLSAPELHALYGAATQKLHVKLRKLKAHPGLRFADFGQRRRHSFLWQQFATGMAKEMLGPQFTGTSNTWMAFNQDLVPIGTNAHELPMVLTALTPVLNKREAQYDVLRLWQKLFPQGGLRVVLPDTYGTEQFLLGMPEDLAEEVATKWRGFRLDSGDPVKEGRAIINWYKCHGVDPLKEGKIIIPSDGLDVDKMIELHEEFRDVIAHPFGWGTMFTNDFVRCHPWGDAQAILGRGLELSWNDLFRGHSIVCKVESANGSPAVKLSNNPTKATGRPDEVKRYLDIFGTKGQVEQPVFV